MDIEDPSQLLSNNDIIRATIGDFGKWQFKISFLMSLLKLPIAWFQLSIIFLAPPTQFTCKNIPSDRLPTIQRDGLNTGFCKILNNDNETVDCTNGFTYNQSIFTASIISEWDLVCHNKRLVDLTQITLMLGVLIGNVFFGIFADRHGRKKTLIICIFLQSILGMVAAWIPWYWGFVIARFLLAIANGGTTVTSFVMCMEVVGGDYRTIVAILYQIPFGLGSAIMSGLAYYLREWRDFHLSLSLLSSFFIFYIWLIPDSPRWLLAVGQKKKAIKILNKAARDNKLNSKIKLPSDINQEFKENIIQNKHSLFETKELQKRTILLYINWLIVGITFYAFSQYLGKIAKNLFTTITISGLIAIPGTLSCIFIVSKFGRKWSIALTHILTGLCFFAILLIPKEVYIEDWPRLIFAALGIIGLSISMPALYLFTGELFPTVLRNAGVGTSLMFSRLGSIIAPLIIAMQDVSPILPLLILGIISLIEGVLILPLPETKGITLPETVEDLTKNR